MRLSTPLRELAGVGQRRAQQLGRIGLSTVSDLIRHLPMRYEREFSEGTIRDLPMDGIGSARGTIVATRWNGSPAHSVSRNAQGRFQATLQDHSERLYLVWFNARYLNDKLKPGMEIRVQGKVKAFGGYPQMANPKWEVLTPTQNRLSTSDRLKPVYPSTEGLGSEVIEKLIGQVLPQALGLLPDPLPAEYVKSRAMPTLAEAYRMAHQPVSEEESNAARRRLAFNELLLLQLGIAIKRQYNETALAAPALRWSNAIDEHIRARFPFKLTPSQEEVVAEISADLQKPRPMNRLLQGDVGSGKTVVALYALLMAVANRNQAALMAPTELLAEQHFQSIGKMLEGSNVRIALMVGGQPAAQRNKLLRDIESGELDIVVGTHALLTEKVRFRDLAVVVVDEQHRFGVMQRAALRRRALGGNREGEAPAEPIAQTSLSPTSAQPATQEDLHARPSPSPSLRGRGVGAKATDAVPSSEFRARAGDVAVSDKTPTPHCLVMTATPIPRTLSLTVFGDLDVSTIKGLPPGRTPIITRVVTPQKSDDVYRYMVERLHKGQQAYVVVPIIDASGNESSSQLKNVRAHAKLLQDKYCRGEGLGARAKGLGDGGEGPEGPSVQVTEGSSDSSNPKSEIQNPKSSPGFIVAAIHGQLKRESREKIMNDFRAGKVHVLVATTVIEVGVDVPNATIMIVEHAERFGLSQLHQLRGRVGRGNDGKKSVCVFIAEPSTEDAAKRMEAIAATTDGFKIAEVDLEIRGTGELFGTRQHGAMPLRVARIPQDMELLQMAKRDAAAVVAEDPTLSDASRTLLRKVLVREYGDTLGLIDVG